MRREADDNTSSAIPRISPSKTAGTVGFGGAKWVDRSEEDSMGIGGYQSKVYADWTSPSDDKYRNLVRTCTD